jgi:hypothetical protein
MEIQFSHPPLDLSFGVPSVDNVESESASTTPLKDRKVDTRAEGEHLEFPTLWGLMISHLGACAGRRTWRELRAWYEVTPFRLLSMVRTDDGRWMPDGIRIGCWVVGSQDSGGARDSAFVFVFSRCSKIFVITLCSVMKAITRSVPPQSHFRGWA